MTTATILTMIVVLTLVWGGFIALAVAALRKESGKEREPRRPPPAG